MQPAFITCSGPLGTHNMAYYTWGDVAAPRTVVCVHGLTRNARDFDKLAAALSAGGKARVIAVDIVGRGKSDRLSDPAHYSYTQYVGDMMALMLRLNLTAIDWIGTSMGGIIGYLMAAMQNTNIRRLVLNDVGPHIPLAALQRISSYVGLDPVFSDKSALESYFRKLYSTSGPMSDADFAHMVEHSYRQLPDGRYMLNFDPRIGINFAGMDRDVDLWEYYDRVQAPTFLLHGALSDVLTHETAVAMTQRGPKAQLVEIPGIGHIPTLTDDHQIGLIKAFLGL